MVLVGTAGHVDHGKSSLVEALTGINPMHLPEEHRRELTIELGFAHLRHPGGYTISLVDVPGHEKLVRTMISGATAFQLALWVVDAREGLMPQSFEHLHILRLLGVPEIIPVITKADVATDEEIQDTRLSIESQLGPIESIPVVDSLSQRGIEDLRQKIFNACTALGRDMVSRGDLPYLPVDRCFVVQGVGTVVTGTLVRGQLKEGDSVSVSSCPDVFRVRSLHNHNQTVHEIGAGHRVGVQLHGIHTEQVRRGDCLVPPGYPYRSRFINVTIDLLPESRLRWKPGVRMLFLAAAFETECRVWGMAEEGGRRWAQIHLPEEACFYPGQRFILRSTNPLTTTGGGTIVDVAPDRLRRVTEAERNPSRYFELSRPAVFDADSLRRKWMGNNAHLRSGELTNNKGMVWHSKVETLLRDGIARWVRESERRDSEISFETLASSLKLRPQTLAPVIETLLPGIRSDIPGSLSMTSTTLRYDPNRGGLSEQELRTAKDLTQNLNSAGLMPQRVADYAGAAGPDRKTFDKALARLLKDGVLLRIDQELVLSREVWDAFVARLRHELSEPVTVSEFGKRFGLSRKYSVPYLECLNRMSVMRRVGEKHAVNRRG